MADRLADLANTSCCLVPGIGRTGMKDRLDGLSARRHPLEIRVTAVRFPLKRGRERAATAEPVIVLCIRAVSSGCHSGLPSRHIDNGETRGAAVQNASAAIGGPRCRLVDDDRNGIGGRAAGRIRGGPCPDITEGGIGASGPEWRPRRGWCRSARPSRCPVLRGPPPSSPWRPARPARASALVGAPSIIVVGMPADRSGRS